MAKINDLIERAEKLFDSGIKDPVFKSWRNDSIRFLEKVFGEESTEAVTFKNIRYYYTYFTYDLINGGWIEHLFNRKNVYEKGLRNAIFYLKNYEAEILDDIDISDRGGGGGEHLGSGKGVNRKNIFIIHGRNDNIKDKVAKFISRLGIEPIILNELINRGQTLLEKLEEYSDIRTAIIIFTNEDVNSYNDESEYEKRARQNLIFEAGYFLGKIGKRNMIVIAEQGVMLPSVLDGYSYFKMDSEEKWKEEIAEKLKDLKKFHIDMGDLS